MQNSTIEFYYQNLEPMLIKEFEKKIYYISERIIFFEPIICEKVVTGVRLFLQGEYSETDIRNRITDIIENEIIGLKKIKTNRVWEDDDLNCADSEQVLKDCIEKKLVLIPADGFVTLKGSMVSLFDFFDNVFKAISVELYDCENYRFPTLLKTSTLKKVGYFESFPNLLMFTTRLRNEISNYKAFKDIFNEADDEKIFNQLMDFSCNTNYGLPPTMCYYVYEMLTGQMIQNQGVTAQGKSFRFENKYYKAFERLWDFTIRETVFLGERSFVKKQVESYKDYAIRFIQLLNLKGFCETANDPFFLVDNTPKKINIQKMMGSKYELRLRINPLDTMAIGSFNVHGQFLAKRFKLYANGSREAFCYTGCIGIGLERIVFGFLSQYGCDINKWPPMVVQCMDNPLLVKEILLSLRKGEQ